MQCHCSQSCHGRPAHEGRNWSCVSFNNRVCPPMWLCWPYSHIAMLIATGIYLKKNKDKIPSNKTVRLSFQPAEERLGGADIMVKEGCLEGGDEIYGYHQVPHGQEGGHGSEPANAIDPITAACHLHSAFHTIKSWNTFNTDVVAFTICELNSGTTFNVIPRTAEMKGPIRYYDEDVRKKVVERIRTLSQEICEGFNCKSEVTIGPSYPAVINSEKQTNIVIEVAGKELGESSINTKDHLPMFASEDFSFYLQKIPGEFIFLNNIKPGEKPVSLHSSYVDFNDNITAAGIYMNLKILEHRLGISLL
ncbi:unnamed protein product [Moneuplotes crassus]|uniref:Peptidase M20 dimerisation domain-containing protein n=1 Tax=Euplotes crassus TaxID=5936 RepID=A0AAD1UA86_EUPCR|nr:unnamed protein product [Moneuplotes crassus]